MAENKVVAKKENSFVAGLKGFFKYCKKNPSFTIHKKQFLYDVVISAFYQYIMFQEYGKPLKEIKDTVDFKFLKEIIQVLREKREKDE